MGEIGGIPRRGKGVEIVTDVPFGVVPRRGFDDDFLRVDIAEGLSAGEEATISRIEPVDLEHESAGDVALK